MNAASRARPGPSGGWDRARRAYTAVLGENDPAAALLAGGALDLRLGHDAEDRDRRRLIVVSGPDDLAELRDVVESATGVGTWPRPSLVDGEPLTVRIEVARPAALSGLLLAMEGLIERRSPWGRWRTMVDTMASRVALIDALTVDLRVVEAAE